MNDFGDLLRPNSPDFKEYSLENWGYILRDSASLTPDVFPYKVGISKDSSFFRSLYDGVYRGIGTTVRGSNSKIKPGGILVEHMATLGVNDIGEVMVSREIFEGDRSQALTDISGPEFYKNLNFLRNIPMPHWGRKDFRDLYKGKRFDLAYKAEYKLIYLNDFQYVKVIDDMYKIVDVRDG